MMRYRTRILLRKPCHCCNQMQQLKLNSTADYSAWLIVVVDTHVLLNRKLRRTQKKQQKLQERMRLKMGMPHGDTGVNVEEKLFSLSGIKSMRVSKP